MWSDRAATMLPVEANPALARLGLGDKAGAVGD